MINTTAVELGLGTGGWHVVHWNLSRDGDVALPGGGHVMKLRYTSLQVDTGVAEEEPGLADGLDNTPVVALGAAQPARDRGGGGEADRAGSARRRT